MAPQCRCRRYPVVQGSMARAPRSTKPRLRGVSHGVGAVLLLPAIALCVRHAATDSGVVAAWVYCMSVLFLLSVSAIYHIPHWNPVPRMWLRRLDHTAIFVLIAGTYTPFCLLSFPVVGEQLLIVVWGLAAFGALQSILWPKAPKWVSVILYLAMGWIVLAYAKEFLAACGGTSLLLTAIGGALYSVGALIYARRWPNPRPAVFGYHEIFHVFVLAALACHYVVVWRLVG